MHLDFCTRRELMARLEAGWRLVPGHEYQAGDWAILLMLPEEPEPMTDAQIRKVCADLYLYRGERHGNRSAGGISAASRKFKSNNSVALADRAARTREAQRLAREKIENERWEWARHRLEVPA